MNEEDKGTDSVELDPNNTTFVHPKSVAEMINQIQEIMQAAVADSALTKVQKMTIISQGCRAVSDLIHCQGAVVFPLHRVEK